jgi:hypothetical protein
MDTEFMLSRVSPSTLSVYMATEPPGFLVWARDVVGASDNKHTDNSTRIKSPAPPSCTNVHRQGPCRAVLQLLVPRVRFLPVAEPGRC